MYKTLINNLEWTVIEIERGNEKLKLENGEDCFGTCRYYENAIYLDKDLCNFHKMRVLAHELTHAYIFCYLLKQVDNYDEEELCEFVSCYGKQIWDIVDDYFFKKEMEKENNNKHLLGGKK